MRVCTLGDLVLDVIVRLREPLARGGDAASEITIGAGGQAANVAAWVAALGAEARFVGKRGAGDAAAAAVARLARHGVEVLGPVVDDAGGGVIVSLVDRSGERTMCPDRGVAVELLPEELDPAWLDGCDWLHVSGYALFLEPVRSAALRAVELAHAGGTRVSVDLASWSAMRDAGVERLRLDLQAMRAAVVLANEAENRELGGPVDGPLWIVKRGAAGCSVGGVEHAALPVEQVVDTTGAGDAFAAGWLVGGVELALEAAARCVVRPGAMPPDGR